MFADYGFLSTVEEGPEGSSVARKGKYYTPSKPIFGLLNALFMLCRFANRWTSCFPGCARARAVLCVH
jgi:hypothetical protein